MTVRPVCLLFLVAAAGAAAAPALAGDRVRIALRSFEEVPSVSSAATGAFVATVDAAAGTIDYELRYAGLQGDVRQAHIHIGQRGVNGGISVFLCQTATNVDPTGLAPVCPQSGVAGGQLSAANVVGPSGQGLAPGEFGELIAALRAGVAYVNVHSSAFPGGEIRGQFGRAGREHAGGHAH